MKRQTLAPKDKQDWLQMRSRNINSTEVAALFNMSPYVTLFELWHRKKDAVIDTIEETERMRWGTRLESAIAHGVAEDNDWSVEPMKSYTELPDLRLGSSFDFAIMPDGILEIKNVDGLAFKNGWEIDEDGTIEAPPHIELQVQTQLLVSDRKYAYIAALVGGNTVALIHREPDEAIQKQIIKKVTEFWASIESGQEPTPDWIKDAEYITGLLQHAEPNKMAQPTPAVDDLVRQYKEATEKEKTAGQEKDALKAQILMYMQDAEKIKGETYSISAGIVPEAPISYTRKSYRSFRVSYKKTKGETNE